MKILHFLEGRCNPDTANGVEKTIYHLAIHQARLGNEVRIAGISSKSVIPIDGCQVSHYHPSWPAWRIPEELLADITVSPPDIVHFHSMYVPRNAALGIFLRGKNIPYVVTPNGNCNANLLRRRPWLKIPFKLWIERPFLNRATFVHSVGDTDAIKEYGVTVPIIVAPNGIDLDTVPRKALKNPILAARPEWEGRTIFTYVGRLDTEQKGLDLMLQGLAMCKVKSQIGITIVGPDWKGRLAGLKSMTKSLDLEDSIHFAGACYGSEKFDYIHGADFFIHTSRWEGLSFSVIEALACSKPCMLTPAANPCGLIGDYPAGLVVEPSVDSIAAGFDHLHHTEPSQRTLMNQAAFDLVEKECQWSAIAEKITSAYFPVQHPPHAV